jgi:hypothetical protein
MMSERQKHSLDRDSRVASAHHDFMHPISLQNTRKESHRFVLVPTGNASQAMSVMRIGLSSSHFR